MNKRVTIDDAAATITATGLSCRVECPSCEEPFTAEFDNASLVAAKTAELDAVSGQIARVTAELAEARALKATTETRVASLSTELAEVQTAVREARDTGAKRDLHALVADGKLRPNEVEGELVLARIYLADTARDAAGALIGKTKWAARLAEIGSRAVTVPIGARRIATDTSITSDTGKDGEGRTVGGQGLAALVIKRAEAPSAVLADSN